VQADNENRSSDAEDEGAVPAIEVDSEGGANGTLKRGEAPSGKAHAGRVLEALTVGRLTVPLGDGQTPLQWAQAQQHQQEQQTGDDQPADSADQGNE